MHLFLAVLLTFTAAQAATLTFNSSDPGNLIIPDHDGANPGVATSDIAASDGLNRAVAAGNSVEVRLIGLNHIYSSDLTVQLTYVGNGTTRDLFGNIGVSSSTPAVSNFFGNYSFRTGFTGDLWTIAIPLTDDEVVPEGDYAPTDDGSDAPNDMSSAFAGLLVTGTWRLTLIDNSPDFAPPAFDNDLVGWQLLIDVDDPVTVPEPSTMLLMLAGAGVVALKRVF